MAGASKGAFLILLVEDSPSDVFLTREALSSGCPQVELRVVQDGVAALAFLHREDAYADAPRPDLILLDLNLPRKDGREVLSELKNDLTFRSIPVVVLTSSAAEQDVAQAYQLHANCYIVKPASFSTFQEKLRLLQAFWLTCVQLPPGEHR